MSCGKQRRWLSLEEWTLVVSSLTRCSPFRWRQTLGPERSPLVPCRRFASQNQTLHHLHLRYYNVDADTRLCMNRVVTSTVRWSISGRCTCSEASRMGTWTTCTPTTSTTRSGPSSNQPLRGCSRLVATGCPPWSTTTACTSSAATTTLGSSATTSGSSTSTPRSGSASRPSANLQNASITPPSSTTAPCTSSEAMRYIWTIYNNSLRTTFCNLNVGRISFIDSSTHQHSSVPTTFKNIDSAQGRFWFELLSSTKSLYEGRL